MADKKEDKNQFESSEDMAPLSSADPMDTTTDDMNSTMMNIDEKGIDFGGVTKTEIKMTLSPEEEESESVQEQLEKKKPFIQKLPSRFFDRIKKIKIGTMPDLAKNLSNTWICGSGESVTRMVFFYLSRIFILVVSLALHRLLIDQASLTLKNGHPGGSLYALVLGLDLVLVLLSLYVKGSPAWLLTLPFSALAVITAYGAWFFHTADPLFFSYQDKHLSDWLNTGYLVLLFSVAYLTLSEIIQKRSFKIMWAVIFLLSLTPFIINHLESIKLELAFFGTPHLDFIPSSFLKPLTGVMSFFVPLLGIFFFIRSVGTVQFLRDFTSRGFARSFAFLMMVLVIANFSLMQKNRVFHALNFFIPQKLDVGGVEIRVMNQDLKVATSNFKSHVGDDSKSRYFMSLKQGKKSGEYLLQVVDQQNFPVKNLTQNDLVVFADNKPVKNYKFEEDKSLNLKKGSYILEVIVPEKPSLITWDTKRTEYSDTDKIIFELLDISKIKAFVIEKQNEKLLDLEFPKNKSVEFPLSYLGPGKHQLQIRLYDAADSEIFKKNFEIQVAVKTDFLILSPLESDTVRDSLALVVLPKSMPMSSIQSTIYSINAETVYEASGAVLFHNMDLSRFADGPLTVGVQFKSDGQEFHHEVKVKKQGGVPKLSIKEPQMGIFSSRQTDVVYDLDDGKSKIAGVKVLVNGEEFKDFEIKDQKFSVPVFRWSSQSEIFLTVQAMLESGIKVSDWVQINKGMGTLDLNFDLKSLDFLNYKKVGLILDASISNLDNWQGKEKWKSIRKIITEPPVETKIKNLNPSIFVLGARKPFYYKDCSDYEELMGPDQYNSAILKRKLMEVNAVGVSPLYQALKKIDEGHPDKIFAFVDSVGECDTTGLGKLNSVVNFIVLGDISVQDKTKLQKISSQTSGQVYEPEDYETLEQTLLHELVLTYEIHAEGQIIHRSTFEDKEFSLPPGKYTLKIPTRHEVRQTDFTLENGSHKTLMVMGEEGKVLINEMLPQP